MMKARQRMNLLHIWKSKGHGKCSDELLCSSFIKVKMFKESFKKFGKKP